jgi:hypothetical protein
MNTPHPYIVLLPGMRTNPGSKHLVVHVKEWVAMTLGEKEEYAFTSGHTNYPEAADERDRRNHKPTEFPACTPEATTDEAPEKTGVTLARQTPLTIVAASNH